MLSVQGKSWKVLETADTEAGPSPLFFHDPEQSLGKATHV